MRPTNPTLHFNVLRKTAFNIHLPEENGSKKKVYNVTSKNPNRKSESTLNPLCFAN